MTHRLFPMPNHNPYESDYMYTFPSPSSSVDCTLSLGTPSTRLSQDDEKTQSRSTSSSFCWDILHSQHTTPYKSSSRTSNNNNNTSDPLLARRCANCDTTSTPLWRNGPRGPKSLCNACGIRFKKEERRATAANGRTTASMEQLQCYETAAQKMPCYMESTGSEFRFVEESERDSDSSTAIPFLSWTLNVTDRPSLVHHFTR